MAMRPADRLPSVLFTRHDRRHAELKLEYDTPDLDARRQDVSVDAWFFFPQAAGVGPGSYPTSTFYEDLHARTRLKTPRMDVGGLADATRGPGPLAALAVLLEATGDGGLDAEALRTVRREVRLLSCMFRRAAADLLARVGADPGLAVGFHADAQRMLLGFRRQVAALSSRALGAHTTEVLAFADEALSLDVEGASLRLLRALPPDHAAVAPLVALARAERARRQDRGDRSGAPVGPREAGAVFHDQLSMLKKFTEQALYLQTAPHAGQDAIEQLAFAAAAATAMLFTVGLQLATLWFLPLRLDRGLSPSVVAAFTAITVGGYVLKDRIKAAVARALSRRLPRLLHDRQVRLRRDDADADLGTIRERVRFVAPSELPPAVMALRAQTTRTRLALWTGAAVLHYDRRIRLLPRQAAAAFPRLVGFTDILRLDVENWIQHFDSRHKGVDVLTESGRSRVVDVENHYTMDIILRLGAADGTHRLEARRVVLSRRGIESLVAIT